jgi:NADH:ubiquinone oxidoreductase subunit 6 (subunit J)
VLFVALVKANPPEAEAAENPAIPLQQLGEKLFTTHAPAVIAVGILLTAVMIGAALFARGVQGVSSRENFEPGKSPMP